MEHEEVSLGLFNNPVSNRHKYPSRNQSRTEPSVHYRRNPSTEQISHLNEPPSYESIQTNTRSPNQQYIYVPIPSSKFQYCYRHRCAIIIISAFIIIVIIVALVLLFTVILKYKGIPCDTLSYNGKSCSKKHFTKNVELVHVLTASAPVSGGSSQFVFYSFQYTGQSNSDVITFSFDEGYDWYVDDLSVKDILANRELVDNGNFESGSLNTYCVCSGDFISSKTTSTRHNTGSYAFDASNFFSAVKLSQPLDTTLGRNYNISFWLYNRVGSPLTVYMSRANQYSFQSVFPLLTIIFLISIK